MKLFIYEKRQKISLAYPEAELNFSLNESVQEIREKCHRGSTRKLSSKLLSTEPKHLQFLSFSFIFSVSLYEHCQKSSYFCYFSPEWFISVELNKLLLLKRRKKIFSRWMEKYFLFHENCEKLEKMEIKWKHFVMKNFKEILFVEMKNNWLNSFKSLKKLRGKFF